MKKLLILIIPILLFSFGSKKSPALILPSFHFKVNSTQLIDSSSYFQNKVPSEALLKIVKSTIEENAEILVLEVSGHADFDEKNPMDLSTKRAQVIKDKLVKLGVASSKLTVKGYGNTALLADKETILKEKDKYHINILRQSNRRVSFRIVQEGRK